MKLLFHMAVETVRPKSKFAAGQLCMKRIHRSVIPLILQVSEKHVAWNPTAKKMWDQMF
jgi:hypothetical protein